MGPTNIALVKLFEAEKVLREAQSRLDAVTRDVRIQKRRVADHTEKLQQAQQRHKELQSQYGLLDLDIKSREAHIEKLRTAQQQTHNNREYQALLIEISTRKVDKVKVEEQAFKLLEQIDKAGNDVKELTTILDAETAKLNDAEAKINDRVAELQAEIAQLQPARDAAASAVEPKALAAFERMADRYDGEAMAAIVRPDKRREEYFCAACHMDLVVDVYNRLHTKDDLVFCRSCGRMLYIPDDLPPEAAIGNKKAKAPTQRTRRKTKAEASNEGNVSVAPVVSKWDALVSRAQGESVRAAVEADHAPVECVVTINDEQVGEFKGKTVEHLERCIKLILAESGFDVNLSVSAKSTSAGASSSGGSSAETTSETSTEQTVPPDA